MPTAPQTLQEKINHAWESRVANPQPVAIKAVLSKVLHQLDQGILVCTFHALRPARFFRLPLWLKLFEQLQCFFIIVTSK